MPAAINGIDNGKKFTLPISPPPMRPMVSSQMMPTFLSPMFHQSANYGRAMMSYNNYYPTTIASFDPWNNNFNGSDPIELLAQSHRNAACHADARHTWSGSLTATIAKNPVYSNKVFLGGVPWDMEDQDVKLAFSRYGTVSVHRPGKEVKLSRTSQDKDKAGYLYIIFESDKQVKLLLNSCTHDFSKGGKWYFSISSNRFRNKDVQVIPWNIADSTYVKNPSLRLDVSKTVFVGALHGMLTAEGLATILDDLFEGVVYVGIDTDKYKYPIGSGRVTFSNTKSYSKAIQAGFIDIKATVFTKKIQIDPFLEENNCSNCRINKGPIFCRDDCMRYLCRSCWDLLHSYENMKRHRPLIRNKTAKFN
jgi:cytoplasmic polyadenylation element-binding protein